MSSKSEKDFILSNIWPFKKNVGVPNTPKLVPSVYSPNIFCSMDGLFKSFLNVFILFLNIFKPYFTSNKY